ncbi:unnamed protein product [Lupinus luteus]|uniref:Uncharacterized protein n=1 Tax=Lupinus luteus TaxID=3873 RepID=A0AAV1WG23_LUPLU
MVFAKKGLVILTIQARIPSLKPPKCDKFTTCEEVSGGKAATLFVGLYVVALGIGGIKGSLAAHGGEQFDETTPNGRKQRSTFFNYFVFCLACGALIAVTFVVFVAASLNSCFGRNSVNVVVRPSNAVVSPSNPHSGRKEIEEETEQAIIETEKPTHTLKFLNNAVAYEPIHSSLECTVEQVEDVKIVLKVLPIFASTIILNCCLAQLNTFSVEQAATMNTKLGSLKVPPASLPIFPVVFIIILAPIYDHIIIPYARKATKSEMGISHLQRIGIGLVLSIIAMAVAAIVEVKRKNVAANSGLLDDATKQLPITFFWIAFQFLFLGSADLFTLAGLLEFLFSEAPIKMRSLATSLSWASLAIGYYLSSVIVSIVNATTGRSNHRPWLSGANINHYHLERFYWLMCVLSGLNFLQYLFWAIKYKYRGNGNNN